MLDLNVPIIPGQSAAGFSIGMRLTDVLHIVGNVRDWDASQKIGEAIFSNDDWVRAFGDTQRNKGGILFSPGGKVELRFNLQDELYRIDLLKGYTGMLCNAPLIGRRLLDIQVWAPTEYDVGDELHYPVAESNISGIAFYTDGRSLSDDPDQIIYGASIYNPNR